MAKQTETGHAKNVANFGTLITIVKGLKTAYNPSKPAIALAALTPIKPAADAVMATVNTKMGVYSTAVAARESAFAPLSKLSTRVLNSLKATDAPKPVIDSVATLVRKLQGQRATPKKTAEETAATDTQETTPKTISSSQMGFDNRINNLDGLIQLLITIPEYAPNEAELKTASLATYLQSLKTVNAAATDAETALDNARIARNEVLYKPSTGLVDVAASVKLYVKSAFGTTSAQYKQVAALTFKAYNS